MDFLCPLSTLSDQALLDALSSLVSDKRVHDTKLLAHIAEVDRRKLYAPEGYSSMFDYCVRVLHLSEAATYKRITTARAARTFPQIFDKLARGEIHHTGLSILAPKLTADNCESLLAAATHKSKRQIEQLLAERFPRPDVPTRIVTLPRKRPPAPAPAPAAATLFDPRPTEGRHASWIGAETAGADDRVPRLHVQIEDRSEGQVDPQAAGLDSRGTGRRPHGTLSVGMVGQCPGWRKGRETSQVLTGASFEVRRQPQGVIGRDENLSGQLIRGFRVRSEEDEPADVQLQGRIDASPEVVDRVKIESECLDEQASGTQAGTHLPRILEPSEPVAHARSSGMPSRC